MKYITTIVLIIVALFVGVYVGYSFEKSKLTNQMMILETSMQKQVNDAKMHTMMSATPQPSGMMHEMITPTGAMMEK